MDARTTIEIGTTATTMIATTTDAIATTTDATAGASAEGPLLVGLQACPDDLGVVSGHDVAVGVRGVRPIDGLHLTAVAGIGSRLNKSRPADLPVTLRRERGDDQVSAVAVDKESVAVPHQETGRPARFLLR